MSLKLVDYDMHTTTDHKAVLSRSYSLHERSLDFCQGNIGIETEPADSRRKHW